MSKAEEVYTAREFLAVREELRVVLSASALLPIPAEGVDPLLLKGYIDVATVLDAIQDRQS